MEKIIDNKKYLVIENSEFIKSDDTSDIDFINNVSEIYNKSTHWLCTETIDRHSVRNGIVYRFFREPENGEYVILNDKEEFSMCWLTVEGNLMVML